MQPKPIILSILIGILLLAPQAHAALQTPIDSFTVVAVRKPSMTTHHVTIGSCEDGSQLRVSWSFVGPGKLTVYNTTRNLVYPVSPVELARIPYSSFVTHVFLLDYDNGLVWFWTGEKWESIRPPSGCSLYPEDGIQADYVSSSSDYESKTYTHPDIANLGKASVHASLMGPWFSAGQQFQSDPRPGWTETLPVRFQVLVDGRPVDTLYLDGKLVVAGLSPGDTIRLQVQGAGDDGGQNPPIPGIPGWPVPGGSDGTDGSTAVDTAGIDPAIAGAGLVMVLVLAGALVALRR